jgi:hypothetical protein
MHIVSIISTFIVFTCLIITLTSIKETPLVLNDDEDDDSEESDSVSELKPNGSISEAKHNNSLNETRPLLSNV